MGNPALIGNCPPRTVTRRPDDRRSLHVSPQIPAPVLARGPMCGPLTAGGADRPIRACASNAVAAPFDRRLSARSAPACEGALELWCGPVVLATIRARDDLASAYASSRRPQLLVAAVYPRLRTT